MGSGALSAFLICTRRPALEDGYSVLPLRKSQQAGFVSD